VRLGQDIRARVAMQAPVPAVVRGRESLAVAAESLYLERYAAPAKRRTHAQTGPVRDHDVPAWHLAAVLET
jgi:hypothetical protein